MSSMKYGRISRYKIIVIYFVYLQLQLNLWKCIKQICLFHRFLNWMSFSSDLVFNRQVNRVVCASSRNLKMQNFKIFRPPPPPPPPDGPPSKICDGPAGWDSGTPSCIVQWPLSKPIVACFTEQTHEIKFECRGIVLWRRLCLSCLCVIKRN